MKAFQLFLLVIVLQFSALPLLATPCAEVYQSQPRVFKAGTVLLRFDLNMITDKPLMVLGRQGEDILFSSSYVRGRSLLSVRIPEAELNQRKLFFEDLPELPVPAKQSTPDSCLHCLVDVVKDSGGKTYGQEWLMATPMGLFFKSWNNMMSGFTTDKTIAEAATQLNAAGITNVPTEFFDPVLSYLNRGKWVILGVTTTRASTKVQDFQSVEGIMTVESRYETSLYPAPARRGAFGGHALLAVAAFPVRFDGTMIVVMDPYSGAFYGVPKKELESAFQVGLLIN